MKKLNGLLLAVSLVGTGLFILPQTAMSAEMEMQGAMASMKMMPHTPEEHVTMAQSYEKKAAAYRQDAEMHRQMLAEYKNVPINNKLPENIWTQKMRKHCVKYIKDANQLANEADHFAQFHTMRSKESQGE